MNESGKKLQKKIWVQGNVVNYKPRRTKRVEA